MPILAKIKDLFGSNTFYIPVTFTSKDNNLFPIIDLRGEVNKVVAKTKMPCHPYDLAKKFFKECCEFKKGVYVLASDLLEAYNLWTKDNAIDRPMAMTSLGKYLKRYKNPRSFTSESKDIKQSLIYLDMDLIKKPWPRQKIALGEMYRFVSQKIQRTKKEDKEPFKTVYSMYKMWCEKENVPCRSIVWFSFTLKRLLKDKKCIYKQGIHSNGSGKRWIRGIKFV